MSGFLTICYCRKPSGIFNGVTIPKKIDSFFLEIHNYKTELSLSESNNEIMNSAVNL